MPAPTLADLKSHLNITDPSQDSELLTMLDAAVDVVEGYVGELDSASVTETHYGGGTVLVLRRPPVLSVTSVTMNGAATTAYVLDGAAGLLRGQFSGDTVVTYTTGRAVVPPAVRLAVLVVAGRLWETQRGNAPSALPFSDDAGAVDPGGLPLLPPRARELLSGYVYGPTVG